MGLKAIGRLEFEIKQAGLGGAQAMLGFRRNKYHVARTHGPHALFGFHRALAFHDEVKVLADFVVVVGRRAVGFVHHHPRQHVVDVGQFLVDEERALAPGNHRRPASAIRLRGKYMPWYSPIRIY